MERAVKLFGRVVVPGSLAGQSARVEHERFLALVAAHQGALFKVAWAFARSAHDRDDLLQEIATRLWMAFGRYDGGRPFSTWMYRVALNVAIDFRRRRRRWGRERSGLDEQTAQGATVSQADAEHALELRELLEQLGDADRALLLLHLEEQTHREIGAVLGISESNVGTRLNRLKNTLRRLSQETTKAQEDL